MAILDIDGRVYHVLPWADAERRTGSPGESRVAFASVEFAIQFLRRAIAHPMNVSSLRRAAAAHHGFRLDLHGDDTVLRQLAHSLVRGSLRVFLAPPVVLPWRDGEEEEEPAAARATPAEAAPIDEDPPDVVADSPCARMTDPPPQHGLMALQARLLREAAVNATPLIADC
jgi:hypothetical protein